MAHEPLVSICIPTYNRAGMIRQAIESALGQSYQNIEVIVVDNASDDTTADVVASYSDKRLRFVKNERNLGLFGNFNRCIELSTGEYLHILHSDDYIDLDFTATCVKFFQTHPSVAMTSTRGRVVGDGFEKEIPCGGKDLVFQAPDGFRQLLASRSFINCPSVIVRRDIYQKVGFFSLEYPYSSDFLQWLRIARNHDIGFVHGACVNYRQGEHSETFRLLFSSPLGYIDMLRIFLQVQSDLGAERNQYAAELLMAQRRFIQDCLYAGFTRGELMPGFSPSIFTGLALTCWMMEKPGSVSGWLGKIRDLSVIIIGGLLMAWSPVRNFVRKIFFSRKVGY